MDSVSHRWLKTILWAKRLFIWTCNLQSLQVCLLLNSIKPLVFTLMWFSVSSCVHWLQRSSPGAAGESSSNTPVCVHVCFFHQHGWPFTCSAWPSQPSINHSAAVRLKWIWKYWESRIQIVRWRERETKRMNNSNADILNHMSYELLTCWLCGYQRHGNFTLRFPLRWPRINNTSSASSLHPTKKFE